MREPVDAGRLSTWVKHRPSMCAGCHALCCTLPVEVSIADLQRMELITPEEANQSIKKIAAKLMDLKLIQSFRVRTGLFTLAQRANEDCTFLGKKDRLCTIYEKRPTVCRKFPELGPKPGWCPEKRKEK
jgi:Fe-S-cluster containining protein